nr:hypothetical protein [Micromonospora sp. DSM 115978]
ALLLALFVVSAAGLFAVWPAMLAPYRSPTGQLVLAAIGTVVILAVRALARRSRPGTVPDFFAELA